MPIKYILGLIFCITILWKDGTIEELPKYNYINRIGINGVIGIIGSGAGFSRNEMIIHLDNIKWIKRECSENSRKRNETLY